MAHATRSRFQSYLNLSRSTNQKRNPRPRWYLKIAGHAWFQLVPLSFSSRRHLFGNKRFVPQLREQTPRSTTVSEGVPFLRCKSTFASFAWRPLCLPCPVQRTFLCLMNPRCRSLRPCLVSWISFYPRGPNSLIEMVVYPAPTLLFSNCLMTVAHSHGNFRDPGLSLCFVAASILAWHPLRLVISWI